MIGLFNKIANQIASLPGNISQSLSEAYRGSGPKLPELEEIIDNLEDKYESATDDESNDDEYETASEGENETGLTFVRRENVRKIDVSYKAVVKKETIGRRDYMILFEENRYNIKKLINSERKIMGNIKLKYSIQSEPHYNEHRYTKTPLYRRKVPEQL